MYSACVLYWYNSTKTDAEGAARLLSATCIEVVMAIVGFNVCFRMAATPLDPTSVSERDDRLSTPLEVLIGICGGAAAGAFFSLAMPSSAAAAEGGRGLEAAAAESDAAYAVASWVCVCVCVIICFTSTKVHTYAGVDGGGHLRCCLQSTFQST